MKQELQYNLYNEFPKIFTRMNVIECDDGWYNLIYQLCKQLQFNIDYNNKLRHGNKSNYNQIEILQIKEKYGGLRFYTNDATDLQQEVISFVEQMSYCICEYCGSTDNVQLTDGGRLKSLCIRCRNENKKINVKSLDI